MAINRLTETVKVKLVDGTEADVKLYAFMNTKERQRLENIILADLKVKKGQSMENVEFDASRVNSLVATAAEIIWADKNYTLDDVEAESIGEVVAARLQKFLGNYGLVARAGDSPSN